jgi:hypothetical protein
MDGSKEHPNMTAGLDIGDKYSYLCLLDSESGEVIQEGRLRTTPKAFRRRFTSEQHRLQQRRRSAHEVDAEDALVGKPQLRYLLAKRLQGFLCGLDPARKDHLALFVEHACPVGALAYPSKPT